MVVAVVCTFVYSMPPLRKDFADMDGDRRGGCRLMLRRPEDLAVEENHVSWAHMYRMMFVAQVGFALAYLL